MKIIQLLFVLFFLASCNFKKETDHKVNPEIESNTQNNQGNIVTTIEFGVKAEPEDAKDFEDGIIPWINIENPENQINLLMMQTKL